MTVDCGDRSESPRSRDWNKHDQIGRRTREAQREATGALNLFSTSLPPFLARTNTVNKEDAGEPAEAARPAPCVDDVVASSTG